MFFERSFHGHYKVSIDKNMGREPCLDRVILDWGYPKGLT